MNLNHYASPEHVEAELNYLDYRGERPVVYLEDSANALNAQLTPTRVRIRNARLLATAPALDRHGFELRAAGTQVRDFADAANVRDVYYPEVEELLVRATGAEKVVVFGHLLRLDAGARASDVQGPVRAIHNDQSFISGPRRVRDHLTADEAEQRLKRRFAIVNVWRPIGAPVQTAPLALCDYRSIASEDIVPADFIVPERIGEVCLFRANPEHRWYYFHEARPDEAILIKIYDSREDGTARLSAHTAFDDPNSRPGAPPRNSIEVRSLVFWPA